MINFLNFSNAYLLQIHTTTNVNDNHMDPSEVENNANNMVVLNNEEINMNIAEVVIEESLVEKQLRQIKELKEQLQAQ